MTDREKLLQAQRDLEQRRLVTAPPTWHRQEEPKPFIDDPARLAELRQVAADELAEQSLPEGLLEVLIDARARQLLRAERDPAWLEGLEARAREERQDELREKLHAWRFPASAVDAIVTGLNDKGEPLVKTESEGWLRAALAKPLPSGRLIALVGNLGTGKTMAACRWAASCWDQRSAVAPAILYARADQVFSHSSKYSPDRPWLARVTGVETLILDQCGDDHENEDTDSKRLAALLLARYEDNKRTIIIANMVKSQFQARYTDAIMSRLYHSGGLHNCRDIVRKGEVLRQANLRLEP